MLAQTDLGSSICRNWHGVKNGGCGAWEGAGATDEAAPILREVYERIQEYLAQRPGPVKESDPLFAMMACMIVGGISCH